MKPVGWRFWAALLFLVLLAVQVAPAAEVTPPERHGDPSRPGSARGTNLEEDRRARPGHRRRQGMTLGLSFGTKPKEANSAWPLSPRRKSANVLAAAGFSVRETMPRYCTTGS